MEHIHVIVLVELFAVEEILEMLSRSYRFYTFDDWKVLDIKGKHSHEVIAEDGRGHALVYLFRVTLKTADDVFDVGGVEVEDGE